MDRKQDKVIDLLKNFKELVEKKVKIESIVLFGSRARGDEKIDSDVDFIIVSKDFKGQKFFKRAPMFYYMWDADYDADIICLTPDELNKKKKQMGIISDAVREGIVIK